MNGEGPARRGGRGGGGRGPGLARPMHVKNKAAAPIQITAEQLVQEAADRAEKANVVPRRVIADEDELQEYRMDKRKQFEDALRRNRASVPAYLKYAIWEESQHELDRARSVYERAVDEDPQNVTFWLKYAEMEMRHKNSNRARNVWDRAVHILPRQTQLWYKYIFMEDVLGNYVGERLVFERWMQWNPNEAAWLAYVKFELRIGEVARARRIHERLVEARPSVSSWLRYAKFEEKQHDVARARDVYTRAIDVLGDELGDDERLFVAFARFEEEAHEDERARAIYRYALDHVPRNKADKLYSAFVEFEKTHGSRQSIEDVVVSRRRLSYEEQLAAMQKQQEEQQGGAIVAPDYDLWFDYIRLEEEHGDVTQIREVYERAVACVPPVAEKRFWRRYIYIWLKYAIFEELVAADMERTREVYAAAVKLVPHKKFSFSKLWIQYAKFEVRQLRLDEARRIFGMALGMCAPSQKSIAALGSIQNPIQQQQLQQQLQQQHHCRAKIYQEYIRLEFQLGEVERCRKLYTGYIASDPSYCRAYMEYAQMEQTLHETERARAILDLAVSQAVLDTPEKLWRFFIDFEIASEEIPRARTLYRRLLEHTKHVKVWLSFARFEHETAHNDDNARAVLREADACFSGNAEIDPDATEFERDMAQQQMRENRALVAETALNLEMQIGDAAMIEAARKRVPKRIKKRRVIQAADGSDAGWEEYWEYVFPGEEAAAPALKLLERARMWKRQKMMEPQENQTEVKKEETQTEDNKAT